jgi:hypothetical protein
VPVQHDWQHGCALVSGNRTSRQLTLTPALTLKKPSGVRSPVQNVRSTSSMSLVSSVAESASVRAISTVGTCRQK